MFLLTSFDDLPSGNGLYPMVCLVFGVDIGCFWKVGACLFGSSGGYLVFCDDFELVIVIFGLDSWWIWIFFWVSI